MLLTVILLAISCIDDNGLSNFEQSEVTTTQIDRLSFNSFESFHQVMNSIKSERLDRESISPRVGLMSKSSTVDYLNDPILKYDMRDFRPTRGSDDDTIYELVGYEDLVPDEDLASLLNARGEIEIEGKVYKISETGTYCFDSSMEEEFYESYAEFEESEGELVDTLTYLLADGIIRYATFYHDESETYYADDYYEEEDDDYADDNEDYDDSEGDDDSKEEPEDSIQAVNTRAPVIVSSLQNIDYFKYPRYCSDAKTVVGKLFQSLFGRNKAFNYKFTSKKRMSSKFFYYDYLFWSSIGITTKMQKKTFLLWKQTDAKEIYAGWGDIITKTELKGNILEYPTKAKAITIKSMETNKYTGEGEEVAYVFGLTVTDQDLQKIIGNGLKSILTLVKTKTGADVSTSRKLHLAGPTSYYTVYLAGGSKIINNSKLSVIFYKDLSTGVSFDALNLSSSWATWVKSIAKTTYELPNTKLVSGNVRTAVRYDDKIGAMSIYK